MKIGMEMKLSAIAAIVVISFLYACSPMNKKYDRRCYKEDLKEIQSFGTAERDVLLLEYYIEKGDSLKIKNMKNITYGQLLEMAKNDKMRREINSFEKMDSIEAKKNSILVKKNLYKNILTVRMISHTVVKTDDGDGEFIVRLILNNYGEKGIKAFKGNILFTDLLGEVVKKTELKCDEPLESKESRTIYSRIKYNKNNESDRILEEMESEKINLIFEPLKIIFNDGFVWENI